MTPIETPFGVAKDRRELDTWRTALAVESRTYPDAMQAIPIPGGRASWLGSSAPCCAWRSRRFLAMLFSEPGKPLRLSVCRTMLEDNGRWADGVTWDELQRVKSECGFGQVDAVEVYPRDSDVVNVANMRHLWILPEGFAPAWRR